MACPVCCCCCCCCCCRGGGVNSSWPLLSELFKLWWALEPIINGPVGGLTRSGELGDSNWGSVAVREEDEGGEGKGAEEFDDVGGAEGEGLGLLEAVIGGKKEARLVTDPESAAWGLHRV